MNSKQREENEWRNKTAKVLARRFTPANLLAVYNEEDAFVTALLSLHKAAESGKPRNYQVTCAGRAIIDEVRGWLGRTGKKVTIAIPSCSLDAGTALDWLPNLEDEQPSIDQKTIRDNDSFSSLVSSLPTEKHKEVVSKLFEEEMTEREVSLALSITTSRVKELKEEALSFLRPRVAQENGF